jgi:hypothetical protein
MSGNVDFTPGAFQPVIEVSQRPSTNPVGYPVNYSGLNDVSEVTLEVAKASNRGAGAVFPDPTPIVRLSLVLGTLLSLRNLAEVFKSTGIFTRLNTPLTAPNGQFLESIIRAYNHYGDFKIDGKTYAPIDAESLFIESLLLLVNNATREVADGTKNTIVGADLSILETKYFGIDSSGNVILDNDKPLKDYILELVTHINGLDLEALDKICLLRDLLDVSNEQTLTAFLRYLRTLSSAGIPSRESDTPFSDDFKKQFKKLFPKGPTVENKAVLSPQLFTAAITNGYNLFRRLSLEHSYAFKTVSFPRYEGGTKAQLASYVDDVLFSDVQLSLSESTAAIAFTTSSGARRSYASAPTIEREQLIRELVTQSVTRARLVKHDI